MNSTISTKDTHLSFSNWPEALLASNLDEAQRKGFHVTIRWFLGFCKRKQLRASVDSIQAFLETIKAEKEPKEWVFEKWRAALVWFYQHADKSDTLTDVPESLPEPEEGWEIELVRSLRRLGRSYNTEKSYRSWCKRFVRFSRPEKPENLTMEHLTAFLDDLAVKQRVSQGTQRQALNALVFWFRKVRSMEIPEKLEFGKARIKKNLPVVLHKNEVKALLEKLPGTYKLMGQLQYGSGMRVSDLLRLRVKDIDYENGYILVRFGKGEKDRRVQLPQKVVESLKVHLAKLESLYHEDQAANLPGVYLPSSLERKYPKAGEKWIWQWVLLFCATLVDVSSQAPRYQADN